MITYPASYERDGQSRATVFGKDRCGGRQGSRREVRQGDTEQMGEEGRQAEEGQGQ